MKVAHIASYDFGGAGLAVKMIHSHFLALGYESFLYVRKSIGPMAANTEVVQVPRIKDAWRKVIYKFNRHLLDDKYLFFGLFDKFIELPDRLWLERLKDKDIIFVYWISNFTTLPQLARIIRLLPQKKVYIVNFDMANFTGGCHYSFGCEAYKKDCDNCPAVFSTNTRSLVRQSHLDKTIAVAEMGAESLSFTPFVRGQACASGVSFLQNYLFSLPVSPGRFFPTAKIHNKTIFVGAYSPGDKRKGFDLLCRILIKLLFSPLNTNKSCESKITLLFPCGVVLPKIIQENYDIEFYPFTNSDAELNAVYNRASLFLNTTLDDSGPVMVLQAMMAGLPVVSHRIGYAADLVLEQQNGILVDYLDVDAFVHAIVKILEHWDVNFEMRAACRAQAVAFNGKLPSLESYIETLSAKCASDAA